MRLLARPHQFPVRLTAGAFLLNSGLTIAASAGESAPHIHGMASTAYPFLKDMDPEEFTRWLARGQIAVGAALLIPLVPSLLAGAALTAFAGGLVGLYLRTPGLRQEGSLRPTQEGIPIAKDIWLLGMGAGLVAEELARDRAGCGKLRKRPRPRRSGSVK
ncbi:hypothetical protein [Streptosporangium sp. NBC_01756]|uniref:hypothetical protein n=1 Tax=Streptosporangium sp. NBC_01756 TaxID=2975950 RepID=UPI002DDA44C9|nr:hypothetical protein [Streptosporangium sp. NBC_01756]WSC86136.1 hypothetical protein OIE48_38235 [Streptosporangium sp. NBC_01756]